jgi:uncharacterized protein (DUF433 family)
MIYRERIVSNPKIMLGKPIIKGTTITVELILRKLGQRASIHDFLLIYPHLLKEDIFAAMLYAANMIANEEFNHFRTFA